MKDDTHLSPIIRNSFEMERKYLLSHNGAATVTAFHKPRRILAIGYDSGIFALHHVVITTNHRPGETERGEESGNAVDDTLPLIHLLSISAQALTAACFAPRGDYIAFGSAHLKQLLVWDWKSEAYVLKEQAHYYDISRCAITADANSIISGGDDGKVKV
uniref:Periodic tryptophan protein 2 n=1 Tax=Lygus hesperus TaxID=30085 RepID=A0A0A9YIR8_LYGHE